MGILSKIYTKSYSIYVRGTINPQARFCPMEPLKHTFSGCDLPVGVEAEKYRDQDRGTDGLGFKV